MKKRILIIVLLFSLLGCGDSNEAGFTQRTEVVNLGWDTKVNDNAEKSNDFNGDNVVVQKNDDGTETMYIYSAQVIRSSEEIKLKNNYFNHKGIYVYNFLPETLSRKQPIKIEHGNDKLQIIPNDEKEYAANKKEIKNAFEQSNQALIYKDVFGEGTEFRCFPNNLGINTEIVLNEYTGINKFKIKVKVFDLTENTSSSDYILFKDKFEEWSVKSIIYTPLAVDKNKKWSYRNSIELLEKNDDTYTVLYTIDDNFLKEKSTKYPITLNQSFYLYTPKEPDSSIYGEVEEDTGHYLSPYFLLGDRTAKGEGWTYVRYETLDKIDIPINRVVSAKYVFHNLFNLDKPVDIYAYAVTDDWCSINIHWNDRVLFDINPVNNVQIQKKGDYSLDITELLKEMIKNKNNGNAIYSVKNSFLIKSETENSNAIIASGDNGLFSPFLEVVLRE